MKKQVYINDIVVNNGLSLRGNTPLDDRLVWEGFESLYVYEENPDSCPLYGQAYQGMVIVMYDEVDGEKKSYLMVLKDASPYIPGMGGTVTAENYLNYWRQDSVELEEIQRFIAGYNTEGSDTVVGYHGDLTNLTADELDELSMRELLSMLLFEFCVPEKVSEPGLEIKYDEESPYSVPVEVGVAMPKSEDFESEFTQDVWQWVSSFNPDVKGDEQFLCDKNGEITFYLRTTGGDAVLDNVTTKVVEGTETNGQIFASKAYIAIGNAKDSRDNDKDPNTEEYYHQGSAGTATSNFLGVTGGWKAYVNAPKVYETLEEAWAERNNEPGEMPGGNEKTGSPFILTEDTHKFYVQWPSATTDSQKFQVWVPASYEVSSVKSASGFCPVYDLALELTFEGNESLTNAWGAQGIFKVYTIGKAAGITNAEVTITKA